ncbi:MAG TPA: hypothetical protein ENJ30_07250 [Desulfobulbaceae bacterium]|nr:hypothetical protein [Desulfobulbaceae bacterium]
MGQKKTGRDKMSHVGPEEKFGAQGIRCCYRLLSKKTRFHHQIIQPRKTAQPLLALSGQLL